MSDFNTTLRRIPLLRRVLIGRDVSALQHRADATAAAIAAIAAKIDVIAAAITEPDHKPDAPAPPPAAAPSPAPAKHAPSEQVAAQRRAMLAKLECRDAFLFAEQDAAQDSFVGAFRDLIRARVPKHRPSVEIGPSYSPTIPRADGYDVRTVDHTDRAGLVAKYEGIGVPTDKIEDVTAVWTGQKLEELLPAGAHAAVIASHVIEHTPDFLAFLQGCGALLAPDGALYLIVPDRRYSFDAFQSSSDPAKIFADNFLKRQVHGFESVYRMASQVYADGTMTWAQAPVSALALTNSFNENWLPVVEDLLRKGKYVDTHGTFFTPSSFVLLIEEARHFGRLNLALELITRSRGAEFLAVLRPAGPRAPRPFSEMNVLRQFLYTNMLREEAERLAFLEPVLSGV